MIPSHRLKTLNFTTSCVYEKIWEGLKSLKSVSVEQLCDSSLTLNTVLCFIIYCAFIIQCVTVVVHYRQYFAQDPSLCHRHQRVQRRTEHWQPENTCRRFLQTLKIKKKDSGNISVYHAMY